MSWVVSFCPCMWWREILPFSSDSCVTSSSALGVEILVSPLSNQLFLPSSAASRDKFQHSRFVLFAQAVCLFWAPRHRLDLWREIFCADLFPRSFLGQTTVFWWRHLYAPVDLSDFSFRDESFSGLNSFFKRQFLVDFMLDFGDSWPKWSGTFPIHGSILFNLFFSCFPGDFSDKLSKTWHVFKRLCCLDGCYGYYRLL